MAARKPEDHKPAKNEPVTVEARGVKVTVDPKRLEDVMILHLLAKTQDGDATAADRLMARLLGPDQWERVLDELDRANGGIIPPDAFTDFMGDVFKGLNPNS